MLHHPQRQSERIRRRATRRPHQQRHALPVGPRRARVVARQWWSDVGDESGWVTERGAGRGERCVSGWGQVGLCIVDTVVGGGVFCVGVFESD